MSQLSAVLPQRTGQNLCYLCLFVALNYCRRLSDALLDFNLEKFESLKAWLITKKCDCHCSSSQLLDVSLKGLAKYL